MKLKTTRQQVKLTALIDPKARKRLMGLQDRLVENGFPAQKVSPGKIISVLALQSDIQTQVALLEERFRE